MLESEDPEGEKNNRRTHRFRECSISSSLPGLIPWRVKEQAFQGKWGGRAIQRSSVGPRISHVPVLLPPGEFSVAAVTYYHKLHGLKEQKLTLQSWRLEV